MSRPSQQETWLDVARIVGRRATCARRQVGCVLVDAAYRVLSTGYNGPAAGEPHCIDQACAGAHLPSGTGLSKCEAIHAEANALLQCANVYAIQTCFVTTPPCVDCVKLLMNTSCRTIVCVGDYPQAAEAEELWTRKKLAFIVHKREWINLGQV